MSERPGHVLIRLFPRAWREGHAEDLLWLVEDFAVDGHLKLTHRVDLLRLCLALRIRGAGRSTRNRFAMPAIRLAGLGAAALLALSLVLGAVRAPTTFESGTRAAIKAQPVVVVGSVALGAALVLKAKGGPR